MDAVAAYDRTGAGDSCFPVADGPDILQAEHVMLRPISYDFPDSMTVLYAFCSAFS